MKRIVLSLTALLLLTAALSAQTVSSGTLYFTRTIKLDFERMGGGGRPRPVGMPDSIMKDYELVFNGQQSYYREAPEPESMSEGGGFVMRFAGPGGSETFCDMATGNITTVAELGNDRYILEAPIKKVAWKLTNETKEILGYTCTKAMTTHEQVRMIMEIENGKPVRKEVKDTVNVEAWFTAQIPCASGPMFQGTLPGMIMEFSMDEGHLHFIATEYRKKFDKKALKAPTDGTPISEEDFKVKQEAYFKEMRKGFGH